MTHLLQACLNGARTRAEHPCIPITAAELAAEARSCVVAGANALHVHPRGDDGKESLQSAHVARCIDTIRKTVPGTPVGIGTGAWIAPDGRARHAHVGAWTTRPDYASVNLCEEDAPEMIILLGALDVGVEAGIWSVQDAERFVALSTADRCLRILVEMTSDDPVEASNEAARVLAILQADGPDLPILLHGENGSAWSMIDEAARLGVSTRIGFEDVLTGPDGKLADNNAALVEAAAARVLCTVPDRNGGQSRRRD